MRRVLVLSTSLVVAVALAMPSLATARTTETRTIRDRDGDDLLEYAPGEDYIVLESEGIEPTDDDFLPPRDGSILNFLQLTDFQLVDEESPVRVEVIDVTQRGPFSPFSAAYRHQETTTSQIK